MIDDNQFSDDAYKIATLAVELWKGGNRERGLDSTHIYRARELLKECQSLHENYTKFFDYTEHRTTFETLLNEESQEGKPRLLSRLRDKDALPAKIRGIFPSIECFKKIDDYVSYQNREGGYLFREMGHQQLAQNALEETKEESKADLCLLQLAIYTQERRNGFTPMEHKRFPFYEEADEARLFRDSESIITSGWLSYNEAQIVGKAQGTR